MQVTSLQHRTLQPATGCGSSCRPTRQQVRFWTRNPLASIMSNADPLSQASARSRAISAASAQDVDQVSADGSQHNANPMEFEELSDIIK